MFWHILRYYKSIYIIKTFVFFLCKVFIINKENKMEIVVIKKAHYFILWIMKKLSTVIVMLRNLDTIVFHLLKQVTSADAKNGSGGFSPISA